MKRELDSHTKPCVPYLAVYFTELEFVSNFCPNIKIISGEKDVINFQILSSQFEIYKELEKYINRSKYDFPVDMSKRKLILKSIVEVGPLEDIKIVVEDESEEEEKVVVTKHKTHKLVKSDQKADLSSLRESSSTKNRSGDKLRKSGPKKSALPPLHPPTDSDEEEISNDNEPPENPDGLTWRNLPPEIQKKCTKLGIPVKQLKQNIQILWNACEFLFPEYFPKRSESSKAPRTPYGSAEIMTLAEKELGISSKQNLKRVYGKLKETGKGGFASVFSARDLTRKNEVLAIKRLLHNTEREQQTNLSEIGFLLVCLGHANIVQFVRCWHIQPENEVWLVMEYLHGRTLAEAARIHTFNELHIAYVAREVLNALKFLHNLNFVHRDLKSSNIMMSGSGHIKLIDFGLCAEFSAGPRVHMVGSPFWVSPEMIKKEPHHTKTDIWSLGVSLLELFLMAPPHSSSGIKCMFLTATQGLMDQVPKTVSAEARTFISRCLEVNPNNRASAVELLDDPWTRKSGISKGVSEVLRDIFLNHTFKDMGLV